MSGSFVLGDTVVVEYTVNDQNDPPLPLSGVTSPAGVTLSLFRQSGTSIIAASEAVTWVEVGATGRYTIRFTPENLGLYTLELQNTHALALRDGYRWEFSVLSAGAIFTPTFADAFCSEGDVEAFFGQGLSATTTPTATAAASFAEWRADVLKSLTARHGYPVTPTTTGLAGTALEGLLRKANAIGAARDCLCSQQIGIAVEKSEFLDDLEAQWEKYIGTAKEHFTDGLISLEVRTQVSLSTDHIISGDTLAPPAGAPPTSEPFGGPVGMSTVF